MSHRTTCVSSLFLLCLCLVGVTMGQEKPATKPDDKVSADKGKESMKWRPLFDGKTLTNWKKTDFAGHGEIEIKDAQLILNAGQPLTGVTWEKKDGLPIDEFEMSLEAMKLTGDDFFCGLTFPHRKNFCSFIVGGWGGGVTGISSLDGMDASENETTQYQAYKKNQWYKIRVRVANERIQCWVDDKRMVNVRTKDRRVSTRGEVTTSQPLGLATYNVSAAIRDFKIRDLTKEEIAADLADIKKDDDASK